MRKERKLRRLDFDLIQAEMSVISGELLRSVVGGYDNDCFWRCISYINSGGCSYSESDAAQYADSYYGSEAGLYYTGAGITTDKVEEYIKYNYSGSTLHKLVEYDTSMAGQGQVGNLTHTVVFQGEKINSNGEKVTRIFDPQSGETREIPSKSVINTFNIGSRISSSGNSDWEYGSSSVYGSSSNYSSSNGSSSNYSSSNGSSSNYSSSNGSSSNNGSSYYGSSYYG